MKLTILTPESEIFSGDITSVKVPGVVGEFEILGNHAPLVSLLKDGKVRYSEEGDKDTVFSINNGFVEVLNNEVSLLVQGYKEG